MTVTATFVPSRSAGAAPVIPLRKDADTGRLYSAAGAEVWIESPYGALNAYELTYWNWMSPAGDRPQAVLRAVPVASVLTSRASLLRFVIAGPMGRRVRLSINSHLFEVSFVAALNIPALALVCEHCDEPSDSSDPTNGIVMQQNEYECREAALHGLCAEKLAGWAADRS